MKNLLLLLLLSFASAPRLQAVDPDYRGFYSQPDAQIIIKIGDSESKEIPCKNHSIPETAQQQPVFQSGLEDSRRHAGVQWSFIKKTSYGDVYLFTVEKDKVLVKAFSILYNGSTVEAYNNDDVRVTIEPLAVDR